MRQLVFVLMVPLRRHRRQARGKAGTRERAPRSCIPRTQEGRGTSATANSPGWSKHLSIGAACVWLAGCAVVDDWMFSDFGSGLERGLDGIWEVATGAAKIAEAGALAVGPLEHLGEGLSDVGEAAAGLGAPRPPARATEADRPAAEAKTAGNAFAQACASAPTRVCILSLAAATAQTIEHPSRRGRALGEVAAAQAEAGEMKGAFQTAQRIGSPSHRAGALASIAAAQARDGDRERAGRTFAAALDTAKASEYVGARTEALGEVAAALAEAGDIDRALGVIEGMEATDGGSWGHRAHALSRIAGSQAEAGDIDGALRTATMIEHHEFDDSALRDIARAQAGAGDVVGALKTTKAIEHPFRRAAALRVIARKQVEAGRFGEALATVETIAHGAHYNERAELFRNIAVAETQAGNREQAEAAFAKALEAAARGDVYLPYTRADALGRLALARAETGNTGKALDIANSIELPSVRAETLAGIAAVEARAGNGDRANRTFAAALGAAMTIAHPGDRGLAFGTIAAMLAGVGDVAGALDIADRIDLVHLRATAFVAIAAAI